MLRVWPRAVYGYALPVCTMLYGCPACMNGWEFLCSSLEGLAPVIIPISWQAGTDCGVWTRLSCGVHVREFSVFGHSDFCTLPSVQLALGLPIGRQHPSTPP